MRVVYSSEHLRHAPSFEVEDGKAVAAYDAVFLPLNAFLISFALRA